MSDSVLGSSVLVLNSSLVAIDLASVRHAFCLLVKSVAEVVDVNAGTFQFHGFESWRQISALKQTTGGIDNDSEWVRTVSCAIEAPRIIRLLTYDCYPRFHVALNRRNLFARDENRCQYCGRRFPTSELSVEHILPQSQGGTTTWQNVVCACTECNKKKGGRTPQQAGMTLIRRPRKPLRNPLIRNKLRRRKYCSWKHFLDEAYWSVTLQ